MPFLLLLVLTLTCLQTHWPAPPTWLTPLGSALLTWLGVLLALGLAGWMVQRLRGQLSRTPHRRQELVRSYLSCRRYHLLTLLGVYFGALYLAGWGWTVKTLLSRDGWSWPGTEFLILSPFLTGLLLSWARFYDVELAVYYLAPAEDRFVSRWNYVALQARQSLLQAVPPLLLLLIQQIVVGLAPDVLRDPVLLAILGGSLLGLLFIGMPMILRLFLGLRPLPAGELRQRLEQTARRLGFRHSDILIWDTHGTLANALVTGPCPGLRYVVLTDHLIEHLTLEEIEAVFGHEVGHVQHRHLLLYFAFLVGSLVVLMGLWDLALDALYHSGMAAWLIAEEPWPGFWHQHGEMLTLGSLVLLLALYLLMVFGLLSRGCERQADLFGCQITSCPIFISALEKVAVLNGISRNRPGWLASWQHSTLARRIEFLSRVHHDPTVAQRFQRRLLLLKCGLVLLLVLGLLAIGPERVLGMLPSCGVP